MVAQSADASLCILGKPAHNYTASASRSDRRTVGRTDGQILYLWRSSLHIYIIILELHIEIDFFTIFESISKREDELYVPYGQIDKLNNGQTEGWS